MSEEARMDHKAAAERLTDEGGQVVALSLREALVAGSNYIRVEDLEAGIARFKAEAGVAFSSAALGNYYRNLIAQGLPADLAAAVLLDAAKVLHAGTHDGKTVGDVVLRHIGSRLPA